MESKARMVKPAAPRPTLGKRLNMANRAVRALLEDRIAVHGINLTTWVTLSALVHAGSLLHRELAHVLGIEGPTLVRKIHALEHAGLVARADDPKDKRATRIVLTKSGAALYRKVRPDVEAVDASILALLSRTERAELHRLLALVTEHAVSARTSSKA
jgi:MarR family transcriptional regulator for hemolysin